MLLRTIIFSLFLCSLHAKEIYTIDSKTLNIAKKDYGETAKQRLQNLVGLLNELNDKSELEKLTKINNFFNKITYNNDLKIWKVQDYWATREEFLNVEQGDCEDYVIAKYFSLRQLDIPNDKIFFTYAKAIKYKQSHMVLTYFEKKGAVPLVLDNLVGEIKLSTERGDLRPLFSFNGEKIYMAKQRGLGRVVPHGKVNLTKWTNLILKIQRESK